MVFHIRRFKPTGEDKHWRTIIEEAPYLRSHGKISPIYGWLTPHKIIGYEIYLQGSSVVYALHRAIKLFEREERGFWRDELGRVLL